MVDTVRRLRPIVPTVDGRRVATIDGDLPVVDVRPLDGEYTTEAAVRWAADLGLSPWLVDCLVDQASDDDLGGQPRQALVQLPPPPDGWRPPPGWQWSAWSEVRPAVAAGIAEACAARLAELGGTAPVPVARSGWARPGWYESACDWIEGALAAAGRPRPDAVTQVRHWGISAVMRVEAGDERYWFKATGPPFRHEPSITDALHRIAGPGTTPIVAADADRSWMLLHDLGPTGVEHGPDARRAIEHLVTLQGRLAARRDELRLAGCPDRPIGALAERLAAALELPTVRELVDVDGEREHRVLTGLAAAVDTVASWDLPETFVHGDFHPGNVAVDADRVVIFDWSDACFAVPFVDAATWLWWYADRPDREAEVWSWFCDAWAGTLGVDGSVLDRPTVDVVASAFHVISYAAIVDALERHTRPEHAEGVTHFLTQLERAIAERSDG